MRAKLFRTLGALLGTALIVLAVPVAKVGPEPNWISAIPSLLVGALFLGYGITGKTSFIPRETRQHDLLGEIKLVVGQWAGQKEFPPANRSVDVYFEDDAHLTDEQVEMAWRSISESYPELIETVIRSAPETNPDLEWPSDFGEAHVVLESMYIMSPESIGLTWEITVRTGKKKVYEAATKYENGDFELLSVLRR